jgi:hypothetical protein
MILSSRRNKQAIGFDRLPGALLLISSAKNNLSYAKQIDNNKMMELTPLQ